MNTFSRRDFLKLSGAVGAATGLGLLGASCNSSEPATGTQRQLAAPTGDQAYLAVAHGEDPAAIVKAALSALGGIERFVKQGNDVIIKPNICVDYHTAEFAATTNPQVVATLVTLCLGAGAARVRVMDMPFGGTPASAYAISGIEEAVKAAGGEMEIMSPVKFAKFDIPAGKDIKSWEIYRDILETDVLIDVPIAKHHSLARLSMASKNLLGMVSSPNQIHQNLAQRIADLVSVIQPTLTIIDAYRILMDHGPTGGSLNDVKQANTIIASHDIVAADSYGATLFGLTGAEIPYVKKSAEMGLGMMDLSSVKVEEVNV
ncbi:MAG TPA: DUF362 domain-containing protein [Anaerolineales bacterium]|nr:DUF362 domain-containing protein [Anaerolineales bacterium]